MRFLPPIFAEVFARACGSYAKFAQKMYVYVPTMNVTPLIEEHRAAGARLVDFAGYQMPLQYSGIVDEHHTVRRAAGLFDVSHMGEIYFRGPSALDVVDSLTCNNVRSLANGQCLYTPLCFEHGGIIDDCLVYRLHPEEILIVVNAARRQADLAWFIAQTKNRCDVRDESDATALIALQGPKAADVWRTAVATSASELLPFHFATFHVDGISCVASRTGYTGEDGYEIFCAAAAAADLWQRLLRAGAPYGIKPCGLGARDTLRLEARLPLYGQDIDETTSPLEAGLQWTVKLIGREFIGSAMLRAQKEQGVQRKLSGLILRDRGIARHGHTVCGPDGAAVGTVTSGTQSPTLGRAIALAYLPTPLSSKGTSLAVDVRGKQIAAEVVSGPFYKRESAGA